MIGGPMQRYCHRWALDDLATAEKYRRLARGLTGSSRRECIVAARVQIERCRAYRIRAGHSPIP